MTYMFKETNALFGVCNFRNAIPEVYELDPARLFTTPGLALQAALKNTKARLDFLTGIDMLLISEEGIRGGTCHVIHQYWKANSKYMKDYDKNKESLYFKYQDAYNSYGRTMSQKLAVNNLKRFEDIPEFDGKFIKHYNEKRDEEFFLEVNV